MSRKSFVAEADPISTSEVRPITESSFASYFASKPASVVKSTGLGATAVVTGTSTITYVTMTAAVVGAVVAGGVGVGVGWWLRNRRHRS